MQKCKQCEWEFPDDIRICPYCGHPVEPEDQKQKRRFKLPRHPGTLPEGPKGRPSGLAPSTAHPLAIALITAILLASLIAGLVLISFLGGHPQTPPPILILNGNIVTGGNISVQGHNFSPGGTVTFTIDGHTATIASGSSTAQHLPGTDSLTLVSLSLSQLALQTTKTPSGGTSVPVKSDGTFEATIQVDLHWPVGSSHLLVATEQSKGQQAHVTINVPRQAELVSCSHSTAATDIALGPVLAGQKQPVSTVFTLCSIGSGMVQWTASWDQRQAKWLHVDRTGQIQAPLSKQITISASAGGLKAGTYTATITFSDQSSTTKISLRVMFIVRSAPATACLNTSAASLSFTATQGQANPSPQSIKLSNCGNPGSWSATASTADGGNWLSMSPASGQLKGQSSFDILVAISSSRLGHGIYTGQVTFKIGTGMAVVNVLLTVQPSEQNPPCISAAPQSLSFSATQQGQGNPASQVATVGNCGPAGSWSATVSTTDGGNWLNINPATGNLAANATQEVSITVSSANLQKGAFTGLVTFKMGSSMAQVSVALTVQRPITSTQTQSQAVKATGSGQTDATNATGTLTFTNSDPIAHTYLARSTYVSKSGVQVAIDEDANVPAADSYGFPSVTVRAHAVEPGAAGNIAAGDVYTSPNKDPDTHVTVTNEAAFTGGQDAQSYTFVQKSDIDGASTSLQNSTQQSAINDIQQQLQPNEHLVDDPQCTSIVSSDHNTGDRVSLVNVTVITTCRATAST